MPWPSHVRKALHMKQDRLQIKNGIPLVSDLQEGIPELRITKEGIVQYIRHKNVLSKVVFLKERDNVYNVDGDITNINNNVSTKLSSLPDYDSGWVNVTKNSEYEFIHNLGSKMLLQQWYFKDDSDNVFNISSDTLHEIINSPTNRDTGVSVFMETINKISIGTQTYFIFSHNKTDAAGSYTEVADGYLRGLLWKIGVSE